MHLSELLPRLQVVTVHGDLDRQLRAVTHDSRLAGPDDVYVAIRGGSRDGRRFAQDLDVAAVVIDAPLAELGVQLRPGVTLIQVVEARRALAVLAAALAGDPSQQLPIVGVGGTNGKTTVTWMIEAIARAAGQTCGVIGTTGYRIGGEALPAAHTTPEAPVLQGLLARMRAAGCALCAMEVSSIGLAQRRVDALRLQVGVFTSFSQDHLDFHHDIESYLQAKLRMFSELVDPAGTVVVCGTDPAAPRVIEAAGARRSWRYGRAPGLDLVAIDPVQGPDGTRTVVSTPAGQGELWLPMPGAHNVDNALAAIGACLALGIGLETALAGLAALPVVPGRMQRVPDPIDGRTVLVDYAHTPDALAQALASARRLGTGTLHLVFGCGGDRDPAKRPLMGQVAAHGADRVWLTSDNPRSEDPQRIVDQVRAGIPRPEAVGLQVILDREAAIFAAVEAAGPGDLVLIAGKGHETSQVIGQEVRPFDDRQVAARALATRRGGP